VPLTPEGVVDAETAIAVLGADVALLALMRAQNETGAIMPVSEAATAARQARIIVHSYAVQAIGKIAVNVDNLGVDLLSIAGHKFYAPKGVGALYVRAGTPIEPIVFGGGQERVLRPGTENVASTVGLGAAAAIAQARVASESVRLRTPRDEFWQNLCSRIPNLVRHTPVVSSLPNTLSGCPGVLGKDVLAASDGVLALTGPACHSGVDTPAETLLAMQVVPDVALSSVRLSLGRTNTESVLGAATDILVAAYETVSG
jgi:cysteine desulfurase